MPLQKLYLELTNKCNLNCSICYRHSWSEKLLDMDKGLFDKVIDQLAEMNTIKSIVLGGIGEPTCSSLIHKALEKLSRYELTLTTNAVNIDDRLADLIVQSVDLLMVSVDGLHNNFSRIRGTNLDLVIKNVNKINRLKETNGYNTPYIGIQFVVSQDNVDDIFGVIDLANRLKAHKLVVSNLLPQKKENAGKILYTRYENKIIKNIFDKAAN